MARSQDRALYDQFQRADALKQERPRDPRLHVSAAWRRIVCVKPDSTSTQVERNAGASLHGSACIYVAEMELELEIVAAVRAPVAMDDVLRHVQDYDRQKPQECIELCVP